MSLEADLAQTFKDNGWKWRLKGGRYETPSEEDVLAALDEAARLLYDGAVDDQLVMGRLIIRKKAIGHDVYVYCGPYE